MTSTPAEQTREDLSRTQTLNTTTPDAVSPWHAISGHWLHAAESRTEESAAYARRQDALRRWRGLLPEAGAHP